MDPSCKAKGSAPPGSLGMDISSSGSSWNASKPNGAVLALCPPALRPRVLGWPWRFLSLGQFLFYLGEMNKDYLHPFSTKQT